MDGVKDNAPGMVEEEPHFFPVPATVGMGKRGAMDYAGICKGRVGPLD